ncbi:MAG: energy transducer TonB [Bryobacteraceae bacterium]|nr:energy transducer TonB [Bryobacteraceae bacterium]MDW8377524.1 energy transducer TonB [Bryobacterales bacterium]
MFEQSLVDGRGKTNKPWTVFVSFVTQLALVGVMILIPLIYTDTLPKAQLTSFLVAPPPPPPPPPPPAAVQPVKIVKVAPRQFDAGKLLAPKQIPKEVAMIKEEELPPAMAANVGVVGGVPGGVPGGTPGGVIGGIIGAVPSAAPPPPPPPPVKKEEKPATPQRIRVGGNVQSAKLIRQPKPIYPPLAKQARIQGTVKFQAIIGKDGTIQNLQLISGHPLLVPAATEAVKQWVYQPTLLNGEPVEVVTQIDVNFTLSS